MKLNSWLATLTKRWHTNALLSTTHDDVGGHSSRVALLLLRFEPDASRDAVIRAITHDLGEKHTADLAYPFKKGNPDIAKRVKFCEEAALEEMGFKKTELSERETDLIRLADWLDSYLWAVVHQPDMIVYSEDWSKQLVDMSRLSLRLSCNTKFNQIITEVLTETVPHILLDNRKETTTA